MSPEPEPPDWALPAWDAPDRQVARAPESDVADLLRETEAGHPGVAIGSYPFFRDGRYGANFVIRSEDGELARRTGEELARKLREEGYEPVEGGL